MKVILKQDIKGVGKKDQVINANDGYARNYLFPKNLAVPADKGNMTNLQSKQSSEEHRKSLEKQAIATSGIFSILSTILQGLIIASIHSSKSYNILFTSQINS